MSGVTLPHHDLALPAEPRHTAVHASAGSGRGHRGGRRGGGGGGRQVSWELQNQRQVARPKNGMLLKCSQILDFFPKPLF